MPLQITSKGFKDISLSFKRNPVTNDIGSIRNEDAIKRSVINLVRTKVGERFFNSLLGSNVEKFYFELADIEVLDPIEDEIRTLLVNFEPRVFVEDVNVGLFPDENAIQVNIVYDIIGLDAPRQNITFVLQPTRY